MLNSILVLFLTTVFASSDAELKPCFDFKIKNTTLLRAAPESFAPGKEISKSGTNAAGTDWAMVSGAVDRPVQEIYKQLLDPKTIRNADNVKVETKEEKSAEYLKLIDQSINLKAAFFLMLRWKEHWGYALKEGTPEAPKEIVISYEKFEGTSYISRFCGNILLKQLSPTKTGVFIYQEMKAERRNAQNILDDVSGTLRTLKK